MFRDSDFDAPFELDRLRELMETEYSTPKIANELDVSESTVRAYQRVLTANQQATASDYTYPDQFGGGAGD